MNLEKVKKRFIPMSETMFYILYALQQENHGYGIMQAVEKLTHARITLGAGTIYQSISKLEQDGLIVPTKEIERRKQYQITEIGRQILHLEALRIRELYQLAKELI